MIRLATGITPNYFSRAEPYLASLREFCNIPYTVFGVDFPPPAEGYTRVNYRQCALHLPKFMLQNGNFAPFVPADWAEDDVVIFTDADAVLQRRFTHEELDVMGAVAPNVMLAGYNMPNEDQILWDEAAKIAPYKPLAEIDRLFPGTKEMRCRNFGFVVARLSTWWELLRRTIALEPACGACFGNPARVQFMACYAAQSPGMKLEWLSPSIHAHGHLGLRVGLERGRDGLWRQDGVVAAFAHAL